MICDALIELFIDLLHQILARERWQGWYGGMDTIHTA
jgi:hypothetical protein